MIDERTAKLKAQVEEVNIEDIPVNKLPKSEFDEKWLYKPLLIRGIFDHSKETLVARTRHDDRGFEVITPLYTSVDPVNGKLKGIFVNRGRIPLDYQHSKMHLTPPNEESTVEGILMYSEHDDKQVEGQPANQTGHIRIDLEEFSKKTDLSNLSFANRVYLKSVQFTMDGTIEQQRLPRQALPSDICYWYVSPQKHQAYATFWFYVSCLNVVANIYVWAVL